MSKINFIGFGGLNEKDKPCYAININGNIYLFDCGVSTPTNSTLGIKQIIPDFTWIVNNASSIKGMFIGTAKYTHFAALPYLVKHLPNLPIYTSDVGATIIANYFNRLQTFNKDQIKLPNLKVMDPLVTKQIGPVSVTPFYVSNYLPKSFGFIIQTPDGSIIFIDSFMISSNRNAAFEDQIFQINRITKGRNLALIVGTGNVVANKGYTNPSHRTNEFFNDIFASNEDNRILIACHDYDLYTVMTIASLCAAKKRPFIIYGGTANKTFQFLQKKNYFHLSNHLNQIRPADMATTKNAVVLLCGTPQRIIGKIEDVCNDEDELLKILPTDYFVYAIHTISGYEKAEAQMFDLMVRSNAAKIYKLPKEVLLADASAEDQKFLVDLLRPRYAIPINGLYMSFIEYRKAVTRSYMRNDNVLLFSNGLQYEFINGELQKSKKEIKTMLQFVNSSGSVDTGSNSLIERETMSNNGVVLIDLLVDKDKKMVRRYNFEPIGIINLANENNMKSIKVINQKCLEQINEYLQTNIKDPSQPINTNELKRFINKIFVRQYEKFFEKEPLILTSFIFNRSHQANKR